MKPSRYRVSVLSGAALLSLATAFACGGVDHRVVTRGPEEGTGATDPVGGDGPGPGKGGSENLGGDTTENPFGGETFTGGAPPVVDGPPEVVEVSPADKTDDFNPSDVIGVKFSEGLDDTTVTDASVKIMDGATQVGGKLSYAGVAATFKPSVRLSLLADYDVQVTQDITDVGGQKLKAPFASKFRVRDGVWSDRASTIMDPNTWNRDQDVAVDAQGNAFVVWSTRDATTYTPTGCVVQRYNLRAGWGEVVPLSDATENCYQMRLAVSPEGDAVVAWINSAVTPPVVRARRYVGGGWEAAAATVDTAVAATVNGYIDELTVAIGGGQALVGWIMHENEGAPNYNYSYALFLSAAPVDGAWPATPNQSYSAYSYAPNYDYMNGINATFDAEGNALVAFNYQSNDVTPMSSRGVYFARKAASGKWQYPTKIPSSVPADYVPIVVTDGDGAMAVWSVYNSATTSYQIVASRYTKTKQFAAPVPIGDPDLKDWISISPRHGLVSNGQSFWATWSQTVGSSRNAYATHYDIASGKWDTLPTVVSDGISSINSSTIGVDAHGNAIVVFDQQGAMSTLVSWARYTSSSAKWTTAEPITEDGLWFRLPYVSVAPNGAATLLFSAGRQIGHGGLADVLGVQYRIFK